MATRPTPDPDLDQVPPGAVQASILAAQQEEAPDLTPATFDDLPPQPEIPPFTGPAPEPEMPEPLPPVHQLRLAEDGLIRGSARSNVEQSGEGWVDVDEETYIAATAVTYPVAFIDGEVVEYTGENRPPVLRPEISDRQFFQQLAVDGIITEEEALAAVKTGEIPAAMQAILDTLPAPARFGAVMTVSGATTFSRYHPLTLMIQQAMQWSDSKLDAFWDNAKAL